MKFWIVILITGVLAYGVYDSFFRVVRSKIGIVNSDVLIREYDGIKEVQNKLNLETTAALSFLDSLKYRYNDLSLQLSQSPPNSTLSKEVNSLSNEIQEREINASKTLKYREQKMQESVINQLNAFVEKYAIENHFDIIHGTTTSGNLVYVNESYDITQEVLKFVNKEFRNEP